MSWFQQRQLKIQYYNKNFGRNSPLRDRSCQPTATLTFTYPQKYVNGLPSTLGVTCVQHVEYDFLNRNVRHKSVATEDFRHAGWAPIPYTARKIFLRRGSNQRRIL